MDISLCSVCASSFGDNTLSLSVQGVQAFFLLWPPTPGWGEIFHFSAHSYRFREEHITTARPVRSPSGILAGNRQSLLCRSPECWGDQCEPSMRENLFKNETNERTRKEERGKSVHSLSCLPKFELSFCHLQTTGWTEALKLNTCSCNLHIFEHLGLGAPRPFPS